MEEDAVRQERELVDLCRRVIVQAEKEKAVLRGLGAVAFRIHCPRFKHIEYAVGRYLTDLDFGTYARHLPGVERVFSSLDFVQDEQLKALHGMERRVFDHPSGWHADVFVDRLRFCHDIEFKGRLEADELTIPLAELLLEKLQIVGFEPKDSVDTFVLLREHEVGKGDAETINEDIIAKICGDDWGFWKTIHMNLERMEQYAREAPLPVGPEDREDVLGKIARLRKRIDDEPKSLRWRMRARVGTRVPWYREVEEISRQ